MNRRILLLLILSMALVAQVSCAGDISEGLPFTTQFRVKDDQDRWRIAQQQMQVVPEETAVVICDMWDTHTCKNAALRVAEMAPRMNKVVNKLREQGCFVIHCPSNTMDFYKDHPARKRAQAAKPIESKVPLQRWCHLNSNHESQLPIDDSDGGCDTPADEQAKWVDEWKKTAGDKKWPWTRQIDAIEIDGERDAITDSAEAYYLMRQRGIKNVIVMGVHTNMCVLGRPFSIRQMVYQGQNVLLMRDMTDAMYNPAMRPFVTHFRGTELVVEHIERYWCPTITSAEVLGTSSPFGFSADKRPHIVFMIGEKEYQTNRSLPAFVEEELSNYRCSYVVADERDPNYFAQLEKLDGADLLVISVRRRTLPEDQLAKVRAFANSGKPLIGLRTSSHAFALRKGEPPTGHAVWPEFDRDVLGGNYQNHHGSKLATLVKRHAPSKDHPILEGVTAEEFEVSSSLYKNHPLGESTTVLLMGRVEGVEQHEPVAWANNRDGQRVFYTSLGGPGDFQQMAFRKMFLNAIDWAIADAAN